MFLLWYMHTTALGMQLLGLAPTIYFGRDPRLPVDVELGLQRGSQKGSLKVQLCLTTKKETKVGPQEGQADGQEATG